MKRLAALSFGTALLCASCSLSSRRPPPRIPVTGATARPVPTAPSQQATPEFASLTPVSGSALFFDGRDDYVIVPDNLSLDLQNGFTIAAWIYLQEYTGWASIVTKGDKPNINNYAVQQSEPLDPLYHTTYGRMRFSGCTSTAAPLPESQTTLSLRTWHFVVVTFDGLQIRFYTDGKPDGATDVRGPLCINDKPLYIGVDFPLTTEYWHGAMDEVRIWNTAIPETQIQNIMQGIQTMFDPWLVGDWTFDEGSGSTAHDRSPYKNDGTLIGDPVWIRPGASIP